MPLVQVYVWKGFSDENIAKIISGITEVFTKMGIPQRAVEVLVHEVPKAHWGVNGLPATISLKDEGPPS